MSITTKLGGDKLLVLRLEGKEQLGALPEWHVDLVGNVSLLGVRESIDLHALLGSRANVTIEHGAKRHFNGFITEAQRGERRGRFDSYRITMRPWTWFATKSRNSQVFQNKSVKDIVTAVLTPYSADFAWRLQDPSVYKPLEYCVQYEESDFDFVSRLLEEVGIYYFFEHTSTTHTLVLTDSMGKHKAKDGDKVVKWSNKLDAKTPSMVEWHVAEEVHSVKAVVRDFDYLATATAIEQTHSALTTAETAKLGKGEVYEFPARAVQNQVKDAAQPATAAATRVAKMRLEELQSLQKVYTGTTNCNDLAVGATFDLEDSPHADDEDSYLVVSMNFSAEFNDHEAIEDLKPSGSRRDGVLASVMCISTSGNPFRPQRRTARPVMYGPQTALVVGASGNEVETDKHGRIKVQFHWDRLGTKNENSSCFVRLSQPWAGKGMGLWMIPRVGHEVVVSFIGGDPDRPLITGSVHNDVNIPSYPLPANSDISGWRTHSTKEGAADARHELRFDDKKDSEYIWLQSQKNFHRHVKEDAFDWIEKNETKKVKLTRKEVVGENWYVNVGKDVMHDLGKDLHTKVAGDIFTTGAATYQLKLEKDFNAKIGADMGYDVTGKMAIKAGGDINLQSGGAGNIKTTGNLVSESGAKLSMKATADLLMQAVNIKAKGSAEIVLEATAGIKIVCGASVITLSSTGVTIDGPMVKVNCGGGGGSAGAAESAAAAEPKAPEDAKNQEILTPAKAEDYDKLFADPLADNAGAAGAGGAGAAGAGAAGARPPAVSSLRAGALGLGAAALAAAGAAAMAVAGGATLSSNSDEPEEPVDDGSAARDQALAESAANEDAARDAEAKAEAETPRKTKAEVTAEAAAAYEAAKAAEAAAENETERQTASEAVAAAETAYEAAKQAEAAAAAENAGPSADEALAASEAAYAAAKEAEAKAAAEAAAAADPPPPPEASEGGGGSV
ncbi:type VI secretion system secreted protein VgrG [Pelomonas saccharophila]|uniref:Type VI secretion system secreted protein VgrG n=1 Tax=Roseateles saccharophilus TaxID=304 RepID=A0ABU1YVY8_ROSSA|nr:type VI secretion system tip protein TssI/VgrG [Roseateles saccharophilus]MDR7273008.1 type VI secretion system secreted protein VgrG [Roseateles saccharophilus]